MTPKQKNIINVFSKNFFKHFGRSIDYDIIRSEIYFIYSLLLSQNKLEKGDGLLIYLLQRRPLDMARKIFKYREKIGHYKEVFSYTHNFCTKPIDPDHITDFNTGISRLSSCAKTLIDIALDKDSDINNIRSLICAAKTHGIKRKDYINAIEEIKTFLKEV